MKKLICAFVALSLLSFWWAQDQVWGQYSNFIPTWKVGDYWKVETKPLAFGMPKQPGGMTRKRVDKKEHVHFKIVKTEKLEGTKCFVLKVTNTVMSDQSFKMYIRAKDFTLKRFVTIRGKGKKASKTVINNPSKPFVRQQMSILCPLDFPQFPNQEQDKVIKTTLGLSNKKLVELVAYNKDKTKMRIEMRTKVNGKPLKSVQYWTQGYPWWSKAERFLDGKKWEVGKLVSYKLVPRKGR